jgi:hypothetical protein
MAMTIEHWRDGECIVRYEPSKHLVTRCEGDIVRIVFPPGQIVLATADELRFNVHDAIETLTNVRRK